MSDTRCVELVHDQSGRLFARDGVGGIHLLVKREDWETARNVAWRVHHLFQKALDVGGPRADHNEIKGVSRDFYGGVLEWRECKTCGAPGFLGCRRCEGVGWYDPGEALDAND